MRMIEDLNAKQIRILGALLEKEQATPEYYPLTVNALLAACNQKSNRDPVMAVSEGDLWDELETLRAEVLVWRSEGARADRWSQSISRRLELDPEEKAVLTVLLLRGPQTVGELRSRSTRLHAFSDLCEVEAALRRMATEERDLVVELSRQPGQKENRWAQLLGDEPETLDVLQQGSVTTRSALSPLPQPDSSGGPGSDGLESRVAKLERELADLRDLVDELVEPGS